MSRSGLSTRLFAIAGIDTAIIVESSPSMKNAQPTMSGITTRSRGTVAGGERAAWLTMRSWKIRGGPIVEDNRLAISYQLTGMEANAIDAALIERWALHYLGRYASSAENLRRVLSRRARRRLD